MVANRLLGKLARSRARILTYGILPTTLAVLWMGAPRGATAASPTVSATCILGGPTTVVWSGKHVGTVGFSWYDANGDVTGQTSQPGGAGNSGSATLPTPFTSATFNGMLLSEGGKFLGSTSATCVQ